ncbi:MAG: hypothetical protein KatS3mg101_0830 [Patescibacteria group bacterium]|nr:MAG: hypothetical protein KatS3mg101_0830 [Patescibacteria group bacterium]
MRTINDYQQQTLYSKCLSDPDLFIGDSSKEKRTVFLFDFKRFYPTEITLPPCIERLYLEILSNAGDNVEATRQMGRDPGVIDIHMDSKRIKIVNGGEPIPLDPMKDGRFVPEMIFGTLLTSSNYDTKKVRIGVGKNGLGAKLANIFSSYFHVEVGDKKRNRRWAGTWKNNMTEKEISVEENYTGEDYVLVEYELDFPRFGYDCYPAETEQLFARHAADVALTCKVPVYFNGNLLKFKSIKEYSKFIWEEEKRSLYYHDDTTEALFVDTPDDAVVFSYVNGLMVEGGVHVNAAYKSFADLIGETVKTVKRNVSLVISCRLPNPKFRGQTKEYLTSPKPSIVFPKNTKVDWGFSVKVPKLTKRVLIEKGIDANDAGGPKSSECVLYIVEGNSAASYPKKRISMMEGNKDKSGYYPIRGKFPNVSKISKTQLSNNKEIKEIKLLLGLKDGIKYEKDEEIASLRYGLIVLTTDMDSDGTHIRTLLLNFFNQYPGIIKRGMLCYLMTFAVRLFDGKKPVLRFATEQEFEQWQRENPNHRYKVKYYKGLGTSRDSDIRDDIDNAPLIFCLYDDSTDNSLNIAFGKGLADLRKDWLAKWRSFFRNPEIKFLPTSKLIGVRTITDIINKDLIQYTIDSLFRSIPSVYDFLKKSQRQSLYYMLTHWRYGKSRQGSVKVDRIAAGVAQLTKYHHGPKSMVDTIIRMCQSFVGSNNLPYYREEGQMGTRDAGGDDAADARYSETMPHDWLYEVIDEELVELVPKRIVDGEEAEPVFIPCDIPVGIINGFTGMATGHSCFCPPHSPKQVVEYLKLLCQGKEPKPLYPFYKGFKGDVIVNGKKVITRGKFVSKRVGKRVDVVITELPIQRWTEDYHRWLQSLQKENRIKSFRDNSTVDDILFTIKGVNFPVDYDSLRLQTMFNYNITLIDNEGFPIKFDTVEQAIRVYFENMLNLYEKYRNHKIEQFRKKLNDYDKMILFIEKVISGEIKVFKQSINQIHNQMESFDIPKHILPKVKLTDLTKERIEELFKQKEEAEKKLNYFENSTANSLWLERLERLCEKGFF